MMIKTTIRMKEDTNNTRVLRGNNDSACCCLRLFVEKQGFATKLEISLDYARACTSRFPSPSMRGGPASFMAPECD